MALLVAEHIDGVPWRELRPSLSQAQVAAAHRALAETLQGVHSIRFHCVRRLTGTASLPVGRRLAAFISGADLRVLLIALEPLFTPCSTATPRRFLSRRRRRAMMTGSRRRCSAWSRSTDGGWLCCGTGKAWAGPADSTSPHGLWYDMTGPGLLGGVPC